MQLRSKSVPVVLARLGSVDINYVYCLFNCCPDCPDAFDGVPVKMGGRHEILLEHSSIAR